MAQLKKKFYITGKKKEWKCSNCDGPSKELVS
jgi:hypothetical protein